MALVTRQRAIRENHPTVGIGDTAWWVPHDGYEYGARVTPVRLLGAATTTDLSASSRATVELLGDTPGRDQAGSRLNVRSDEVGPDTLREHAVSPLPPGRAFRNPPSWALDLFCPVHGHVHVDPTSLCEGEPQPRPPLPGDAVRVAASWNWGAMWVKVGDIGVLDGVVGSPITSHTQITFKFSTFRDDNVVSSSGGPGTIATPVEELTRTDDTTTISVWQWRDGFPQAHNGIRYPITVPVWEWHPTN